MNAMTREESRRGRVLEWSLNSLTVILAVSTVLILVGRFGLPVASSKRLLDKPQPGSPLSLEGIEWSTHPRTLVLGLSTGCEWCRRSASFHRNLASAQTVDTFRLIALFPEPVGEAEDYLHAFGIKVSELYQADLKKLGIAATPSVLLVDKSGLILSSWVGKLTPQEEVEVFRQLGNHRALDRAGIELEERALVESDASGISTIGAEELAQKLREGDVVPIIDIRPREDFAEGHIGGALNIPVDELEVRAVHEVPTEAEIIVFCSYSAPCQRTADRKGIPALCLPAQHLLKLKGFTQVKLLLDGLTELNRSGVAVHGKSPLAPCGGDF